jgi:RHS repeat-associated protein
MLGWKQVYYSSASQALEERVGSEANAVSQYVWNLGYVDDLVLRDRDTDFSGSVDERLYSLADLRYGVMALANLSGTIVERFKYDAHGIVSVLDDAFASRASSDYDWEFRHTGRRTDLETGLQYFRARYYSPELGRFISRDPLGFVDGMSLYRAYFVPGGMDPFGLDCVEERGKTRGFDLPANHGWSSAHFRNWYFNSRNRDVSLKEVGLYWTFWNAPDVVSKYDKFKSRISDSMCLASTSGSCEKNVRETLPITGVDNTDVESEIFAIGTSSMKFVAKCSLTTEACDGKCDCETFPYSPTDRRAYTAECTVTRSINDEFSNPLGHWGWFEFELWGGHPYGIDSCYEEVLTFSGSSCDCGEKGIGRL